MTRIEQLASSNAYYRYLTERLSLYVSAGYILRSEEFRARHRQAMKNAVMEMTKWTSR